ncbi:PTS sugar transporter subunit IIA [Rubrivirga marina]|uniref:PTS EIIA type-2 domain-containing protein n=1 Tax=Rubrivirga marina TaxID=1196024 RepID=A0A271J1B7_9BACT|nr:PTS sugar transporter subunit IIA [Rubrivirga marina]PAP77107.1 hypothetical protein BSZ37_12060 [Rubrivirga marina]
MSDDRPRPWWKRGRPALTPPPDAFDASLRLPALLAPGGVAVWTEPVDRQAVVAALAPRVADAAGLDEALVLRLLQKRDALGSTHLGEGVDLPHARVDGLEWPAFALGLTRGGVADAEAPTEVVWLLLLPPGAAGLGTTAQVARACHDADFRHALRTAGGTADVRAALARWERAHEAPPAAWGS